MRWLAFFTLILAAALAATAEAATYYRVVELNATSNITAGDPVAFSVAKDLLGSFSSLYVTNNTRCEEPFRTYFYVGSTLVTVVFESPVNITEGENFTIVLCYGDVQYTPTRFFQSYVSGDAVIETDSSKESLTGYDRRYLAPGDSIAYTLETFSHVYTSAFYIYCYGSCTLKIRESEETVTVSRGWYSVEFTTGFDSSTVTLVNLGQDYIYLYYHNITYAPFVINSTTVRLNVTANWIDASIDGDWFNLSYAGGSVYVERGRVGGTYIGDPPIAVHVDPAIGVVSGSERSVSARPADPGGGDVEVTLYAYGYEGSETISYSVGWGLVKWADVIVAGPESVPSSGGQGGQGGSAGNATVIVVGGGGDSMVVAGAAVAAAVGAGLLALSVSRPEMLIGGLVSSGLASALLMRYGEPRIGKDYFIGVVVLSSAVAIYHIVVRVLRRW